MRSIAIFYHVNTLSPAGIFVNKVFVNGYICKQTNTCVAGIFVNKQGHLDVSTERCWYEFIDPGTESLNIK